MTAWVYPVDSIAGDDLDPSLAVDESGRPYLAWWRNNSGQGRVYMSIFLATQWMIAYPVTEPGVCAYGQKLGRVCAQGLGPGVTDLELGSRVMALVAGGAQAEEAMVDRGSLMVVPEQFSDEHAGGFPEVYLTAFLNLFVLGGLSRGQTALVHGGSGGVGSCVVQMAKALGARVMTTAGSDDKVQICRDLGAELVSIAGRYRVSEKLQSRYLGRAVLGILRCGWNLSD